MTLPKRRARLLFVAALLMVPTALIVQSFQGTQLHPSGITATYAQDTLRVTIPYHAPHPGAGQLVVEVLNPEDEVLGRVEQAVDAGAGQAWWQEDLKLATAMSTDDLVWHRLHYRFVYQDGNQGALEGTESISQILLMPVIHIIGQQSYLSGGPAGVRVVVTDSKNNAITGASSLRIEVMPAGQKAQTLFTGRLNRRGTAEAQFRFPAGLVGTVPLRYVVETPIGSSEFTQQVRLEDKASILLTTEKPIYQPGQTIHVRALSLDRANHEATANRKLIFEVEDSHGNKVFKKATQTDAFGIASAEFALADEVNLGTYHLRALMGEPATNTAELALNVDRYVLPKFKVAVEIGGDKGRHGYRPGDHVTGTVRANYFFGKAVDGAEITVKGSGMDVAMFEVGQVSGKTDGEGVYHFDLKLPEYFAGRPLAQNGARVLMEATVKDSAGHAETRGEPIMVSQSPLMISAVPEGGTLIPNLENQVFVLTSYADGKPAAGVTVHVVGSIDTKATTDAGGVAELVVAPHAGSAAPQFEAVDSDGNRVSTTVPLDVRTGADQILLRTERAVYRAGDRIRLKLFSTRKQGSVYVDIVRQGQTILTRDVDLVNGQAELNLTATPDLAGTVDMSAYLFGKDARPVADHRLVFVQPADELKVEATANATSYKPGQDARIQFRVTNSRGEGVRAVLGLQVVDEAVFALAEKQPGFAKVFFYLEQEVMKPRYEIHSVGMPEVVETADAQQIAKRDRGARALFAATELVSTNKFETEVGRSVPAVKFGVYAGRYQSRFTAQVQRIAEQIGKDSARPTGLNDFSKVSVALSHQAVKDAWGSPLHFDDLTRSPQVITYFARSAGPDKQFDTADDVAAYVQILPAGKVAVNAIGRAMGGGMGARRFERMDGMARFGVVGGTPGGVLGGILNANEPMPMAAPMMVATKAMLSKDDSLTDKKKEAGAAGEVRVRSYFPEALYINPEIITDHNGLASISIPMADSITTWRMAMMASTTHGALGSGTSSLKVFQDFFVDLDMPLTLTHGDRVSIPVAAYNYSAARGDVRMDLKNEDWFRLVEDVPSKTVGVEAGRVGGSQFTLEAARVGKFKLTLSARMNDHADIVVREIEVVPNGREQNTVFNGRVEASPVTHVVDFPAGTIADSAKVFVRLYPGPLSQVIEGMDSILRMPGGCFEQTSSSTYPNVLALDYMKRTKKLTPEVHAKAEGYIANGYQRLLTFEVPGGGFSWFGNPPANKILTSYGLMEFSDMSKVYDVDPNLITRTQQWLAGQQQADGSWKPDKEFINEGATNRYNTDTLRITAYIAWALENTGFQGPAIQKARQFIDGHMNAKADAYTLAVVANFAAEYRNDREFTRRAIDLLIDARTEKDQQVWWTADETGVYATGTSAAVETTGLAVQALLKAGNSAALATKALNYIASKKEASGTWGSTQATIMALRALLLATSAGANVNGNVEITLNGKPVETLKLTNENNDLFHQFVLKGIDAQSANRVQMRFTGQGTLAYQVVGRYFIPWDAKPANEPMSITVNYDRTQLAQDDIATATATVKNNLPKSANMVMVDLGIPPGFDLLGEDLQTYIDQTRGAKSGRLEKFSMTATQAILYFDTFAPGDTVNVKYRLRAKYPLRAKTFSSRVYEYYDPAVSATARPIQLEVRKK